MDAYPEKYGNRAIRKNLTIPVRLNAFAEGKHINFSRALQDSLTASMKRSTPLFEAATCRQPVIQ
jgi:hypothetical protein